MSCRNEQAGSEFSSFFPAQKHGIAMTEKQEYLRVQRKGVVVEPLNFPATKSVLWNRTAQGDPEILHLTRKRNLRLHINEKTLRLAHRHVNQTKSPLVCFLVGSISVDSREDSIDVTVDRFDPGREVVTNKGSTKVKRKVPTTVVPGDHVIPTTMIQGLSGADSSVTHTKEEFQKAFQVLFGRVTSQEPINISHFLSVKASCHSYAGDAELILNVNCSTISMATRIQATPVAAVPIIPTALARNLSGPLRMSEVQGVPKNGYITMDHTRKLLLLLESDPKAISLPLLGIWVSGIYSIHHPYIWACCLRFIHSTAIQHRVLAPPNSFLLLLYSPVKSTPEFWECKQDQEECEQQMFELYSCYENLHLEIPAGPSSSDPLCFELFPSPRGMSRSLFEQAVEMWKTTHIESKINQDGMAQSPKQEVSSSRKKHGDEDPTLVPRPSPFPHPQKAQFLFPDVAETSLSLSFDDHVLTESSYQDFTNQQILPRPQPTKQQLQTPNQGIPSQQNQHDQENDLFMLSKDKLQSLAKRRANVKQLANNRVTQNSPSREPLKQILSSNQPLEKGMSNKQPHLSRESQTMKGIPNQKCPKPRSKPEMGINGHNVSDLNSKSNNRNPALKVGNNVCGTAGRQQMQLKPSATKGVKTDDQECNRVGRRPFTQGMMKAADQAVENCPRQQTSDKETRALPIRIDQVQGPFLETVFEGETPDGTLNKTMDETEMEYHITRMSEMSQSPSSVPCFLAVEGKRCQDTCSDNSDGLVQIQQSHGNQRNYSDNREDSYKELVATAEDANKESLLNKTPSSGNIPQQPSRKQSNGTDKNCIDKKHKGSPPEEYVLSILPQQSNEKDCTEEVIPPDPYALLLRQEAQLRELQEQIKLLLQQQSAALPNPNTLLTPPRTPQFDAFHGNRQSPNHSPVPMVTACTNTGASLLLGTPIKPNGKKSASTSPMKEDEVNCKKRSLPSLSAESSQHNSKESHRPDLSINPEELTNQVIELDDPSQTLASSLHAVDLPSFFESRCGMTSPNPPDQTNKGGMETSFTSPVLGESASILIEQKENEQRGQSVEKDEFTDEESLAKTSNHVSLLQRNEQQFYDNLLNQVKHILSHQDQDKSDTLEQSPQVIERLANSNKPEPTREEVIEATMKELDKMKHLTLGNEEMQSSKMSLNVGRWPIHRSVSLDVISAHPQINYMSLTVDETIDEVFSEADLKYLTDHQLLELQDIRSYHKKQSLDSAVTLQEGKSILSTKESMEKGLVCDSSSLTAVDYTWNNLSMATKNYLGKYCLAPRELVRSNNSQVDQHETEAKSKHEGPNSSLASQGCTAPPCTPEPTTKNEADSQILDITRLKKLPKLF